MLHYYSFNKNNLHKKKLDEDMKLKSLIPTHIVIFTNRTIKNIHQLYTKKLFT